MTNTCRLSDFKFCCLRLPISWQAWCKSPRWRGSRRKTNHTCCYAESISERNWKYRGRWVIRSRCRKILVVRWDLSLAHNVSLLSVIRTRYFLKTKAESTRFGFGIDIPRAPTIISVEHATENSLHTPLLSLYFHCWSRWTFWHQHWSMVMTSVRLSS